MRTVEEILEEYRHTGRKKRDEMWLRFINLRGEFDEIERNANNLCVRMLPNPLCCSVGNVERLSG